MPTVTQSWVEEFVDVGETRTQVLKGGSGAPVLVLHGAGGNPGWLPYHEALAEHFTVYAPSHPGYDHTPRPSWVSTMTDVAHFYLGFMRALGLERPAILGFSMGGWIAAEIAAMRADRLRGLVLVDAVGIRPRGAPIAEVLMVPPQEVQKLAYYDLGQAPPAPTRTPAEEAVQWSNREMASRLCWKPYMHNPKLPEYLRLVQVPTLIVWGRQDRIVPLECGEMYQEVLQGSTLHVIDQCGHVPHREKTQEFLAVTVRFLSYL
jgi:pimeloyl-ACP methyl ester carboxylesterase